MLPGNLEVISHNISLFLIFKAYLMSSFPMRHGISLRIESISIMRTDISRTLSTTSCIHNKCLVNKWNETHLALLIIHCFPL